MTLDRVPLRLPHVTLADPTLTHQVVFIKPNFLTDVYVSCNCLGKVTTHSGKPSHALIGKSPNLDVARERYNDPRNHLKPFNEEDRAKW